MTAALVLSRLRSEIEAAQDVRASIVTDLEAAERHILALQAELRRLRTYCAEHHTEHHTERANTP